MNKLNTIPAIPAVHTRLASTGKWILASALTAVLVAGCGGGGGGGGENTGGGGGEAAQARGIDQNVNDLIVFMKGLIAQDENSEMVDVNPLSLAVDHSGDPAPL